jgi:hypothetical protein
MSRDPFASYDSWLERPYQDAAEASDRAEWLRENSTYETTCCGADVAYADVIEAKDGTFTVPKCAECGELASVRQVEPPEPDGDDEPPDFDDRDLDRYEREHR